MTTTYGGVSHFISDGITTASPQRLLVMLYDRLLLDLDRAQLAIARFDHNAAHEALVHAQDILTALDCSLDLDVWPAAETLSDIYGFVSNLLVEANLRKDATVVAQCRELIDPIRDAWYEAAGLDARAA